MRGSDIIKWSKSQQLTNDKPSLRPKMSVDDRFGVKEVINKSDQLMIQFWQSSKAQT